MCGVEVAGEGVQDVDFLEKWCEMGYKSWGEGGIRIKEDREEKNKGDIRRS